jgi:hypothetical protein
VADLEGSFAAPVVRIGVLEAKRTEPVPRAATVAAGYHQIEVLVRASLFAEQGNDPQPPLPHIWRQT